MVAAGRGLLGVAVGLCLVGASACKSGQGPAGRNPNEGAPSAPGISRLNINGRAIYASPELEALADELIAQCVRLVRERTPRLAFYYFTLADARHHLGESLAQDLATQMVLRAQGRLEVYTRRKLTRVLEEQAFQGGDLVDEATLVRAGRLSGVDLIVSGRLVQNKPGTPLELKCQLLDLASGAEQGSGRRSLGPASVPAREPLETSAQAAGRIAQALVAAHTGPPRRLAIYDVTRSRERFAQGKELAEDVGMELARLPESPLRPLTRSALDQIIEEQRLELTETFDETRRCQIARLAGAHDILTGFGEIFAEAYKINLQIVDVETARIRAAAPALLVR